MNDICTLRALLREYDVVLTYTGDYTLVMPIPGESSIPIGAGYRRITWIPNPNGKEMTLVCYPVSAPNSPEYFRMIRSKEAIEVTWRRDEQTANEWTIARVRLVADATTSRAA